MTVSLLPHRLYRLAMLLVVTVLVGCASVPEGMAVRLGWVSAAETIDGLDYLAIEQLALADGKSCEELAAAHREERRLRVDHHETLLVDCRDQVRERQQQLAKEREIEQLIAWGMQQAAEQQAAEQARREAEQERQRQAAAAARARQKQRIKEQQKQQEVEPLPPFDPRNTEIYAALQTVSDKPLAYTIGEASEHSLKTFMACLEREYSNQGYKIDRHDNRLTIRAEKAQMVRGEVPIEVRLVNVWEQWLLESLQVANVRASSAQDRYKLAQSLLAPDCPTQLAVDQLDADTAGHDEGEQD